MILAANFGAQFSHGVGDSETVPWATISPVLDGIREKTKSPILAVLGTGHLTWPTRETSDSKYSWSSTVPIVM